MLDPEISIDNYKVLCCDRNRQGGGVVCYVRNDLSYNTLPVFYCEVENIFFEILQPYPKPIIVMLIVMLIIVMLKPTMNFVHILG